MTDGLAAPPISSSHKAAWQGIQLEHHRQPAHTTTETSFPFHTIEVNLHYAATEIKVNGKTYQDLHPQNIGILPAHTPIAIESYSEAEFILLTLEPTLLAAAADKAPTQIELHSHVTGQDPLIYEMALAMYQELRLAGSDSRLYAESLAISLAHHLVRRYSVSTQIKKPYTRRLSNHQLQQTIEYIQAHFEQPLSLTEMAQVVQISPNYFATLFKRSTGISPYQYVKQTRIEQAKRLLAESELSITDIAHQIGFTSHSHFCKVFREQMHITPSYYRQQL